MTDIASPVPVPAPGAAPSPISRAIYGMPMFATLLVDDLERTTSWYIDGLGFIPLFTIPGPSGPALVHLRRWQFQDLLVRSASGPVTSGNASVLSFAAVFDELDDLAAKARAHGGGRADGPSDTAWNTRDLTTVDPDGNVVIFTATRPIRPRLQRADAALERGAWDRRCPCPIGASICGNGWRLGARPRVVSIGGGQRSGSLPRHGDHRPGIRQRCGSQALDVMGHLSASAGG